ncbi:MAG TPA: HAMP domain-containing sensor histidine kinase [Solirubrobacteraceae bacterium]|nr:HAMP domain-containing sensor histidine kinase [Solirubrobacteraceae bacterium]
MRRALSARLPSSLRWRLTAWVAAVMLIAAAVVFAVVYINTGTQIRSQIDRDIRGDTVQFSQALRPLAGRTAEQVASAARRYVRAQPYSATSTLLFGLVPGAGAISNHPEVFGASQPENGETTGEQNRENRLARELFQPHLGYSVHRIPDVGPMRIHERQVQVGNLKVVVGAGEPLVMVERAQHGVARAFALAGAITLVLALVASYLAGARVTAPLRRMAGVAQRVDAGDLEPRMDPSTGSGHEVQVLAEAFNHMLDRLAEAFRGQREFVADASHELRTPLTVIRGQLEVLAVQEDPPGEEVRRVERLVQSEISRISRLVDDLLLLAQAEQTDFLRPEEIDVRPFVDELWDGVSLTAERRFELGPIPEGTLRADPDRVAQAVRNLARNAIEHTTEATGLVRLELDPLAPDKLRFAVIDDGPGIPAAERERIFERFHRTDPARSRSAGGAGLGLAIVRAIAEAHSGQVRARATRDGRGARVELILPGFQPA